MAAQVILVDTSVLIDYFRKSDKSKTRLRSLALAGHPLCISVITEYEVFVGANADQLPFWSALLERITVLPLGSKEVHRAAQLQAEMKRLRKQLELPDLFIAATALEAGLPIATLNTKHFTQIPGLSLHDE